MTHRPDIVELLRAGCSDREVARRLGVDPTTAAKVRTALGLPRAKSGPKPPSSPQDAYRRHTRPLPGGHLKWVGPHNPDGTPCFRWNTRQYTAGRVAFVMQHGRPPVGYAKPGCDIDGCVAPQCMEDQPMRDQLRTQLASIFGGTA